MNFARRLDITSGRAARLPRRSTDNDRLRCTRRAPKRPVTAVRVAMECPWLAATQVDWRTVHHHLNGSEDPELDAHPAIRAGLSIS